MIFWSLIALLLILSLIILFLPIMRGAAGIDVMVRHQQNIEIAREQKTALDAQFSQGEIDQASYDSSYADLQGSLAIELEQQSEQESQASSGRWALALVALLIPIASVSLYLNFGAYQVIQDPTLAQARAPKALANMSLEEMLSAIKARLRETPDSVEGWYAMGRVHGAGGQFGEAVAAYRRAHQLAGDQPEILFSLADAIAMQEDGNLLGEPEQLIARGLDLAPRFPNGLWLAGLAAEQRQNYSAAHEFWSMLLPLIADNQESSQEVMRLMATLEQREPTLASGSSAIASTVTAEIIVKVDISPELKAKTQPEQAVFVYAKALNGPPMPLAVKKMTVGDLPTSISLSDADAMLPSMKLSAFPQVTIGARVSRSGDAVRQPGDFFTEVQSTQRPDPSQPFKLLIDRVFE